MNDLVIPLFCIAVVLIGVVFQLSKIADALMCDCEDEDEET